MSDNHSSREGPGCKGRDIVAELDLGELLLELSERYRVVRCYWICERVPGVTCQKLIVEIEEMSRTNPLKQQLCQTRT